MHALLRTYQIQPERIEERLRHYREVTLPTVGQRPGHMWGALLLADRANEETIAIALWRSAADLEAAAGNAGYEELRPHHHFAAGPVTHEQLEVAHYGVR